MEKPKFDSNHIPLILLKMYTIRVQYRFLSFPTTGSVDTFYVFEKQLISICLFALLRHSTKYNGTNNCCAIPILYERIKIQWNRSILCTAEYKMSN